MNNVDKQYLDILKRILNEGNLKQTRAGDTLSIFGVHAEFDLKEGLPLLTTKKVFYKGIIHELIWFLRGETNIRYLVQNKVNIWNDDAYRWFKNLNFKEYNIDDIKSIECDWYGMEHFFHINDLEVTYDICDYEANKILKEDLTEEEIKNITEKEFITHVIVKNRIRRYFWWRGGIVRSDIIYTFGDLGPIYGKQWRSFGISNRDQIQEIINTLKTNPDDRRMLCISYNPDVLDKVALPACHTMFQFYTRELTHQERFTWLQEHGNNKFDEWKTVTEEKLNELNVPKRALSLSFYCRSQDFPLGTGFNWLSYSMLQYIIANICNMAVDKLVYYAGDTHIYLNQIDGCKEQLQRKGSDKLAQLIIKRQLTDIDDISFDDFEIMNYVPDPPIKIPLSVG